MAVCFLMDVSGERTAPARRRS